MKPLNKLKKFLDKKYGDNYVPDESNLEKCLEDIKHCILSSCKGRKPSISPSQTKMSARDMWLILNGRGNEIVKDFTPELKLKMLAGSVLEPVIVFLMKEAGVKFDSTQASVELTLPVSGYTMRGSCDYVIDGKVWDLKTTNSFSFNKKFKSAEDLAANDSYGYLGQGGLYAMGAGLPFGGWHAIETNFFNFKEMEADEIQYEIDMEIEHFDKKLARVMTYKTLEELEESESKDDGGLL